MMICSASASSAWTHVDSSFFLVVEALMTLFSDPFTQRRLRLLLCGVKVKSTASHHIFTNRKKMIENGCFQSETHATVLLHTWVPVQVNLTHI